jgi:hypothetical protein
LRLFELEATVERLTVELAAERGGRSAECTLGPPSRQTLRRAVHIVATAQGHRETAAALRQLAAAAEAWANDLDVSPGGLARIEGGLDFEKRRRAA